MRTRRGAAASSAGAAAAEASPAASPAAFRFPLAGEEDADGEGSCAEDDTLSWSALR